MQAHWDDPAFRPAGTSFHRRMVVGPLRGPITDRYDSVA